MKPLRIIDPVVRERLAGQARYRIGRELGAKRDDLQAAMALVRKELPDLPLSFNNLRD